MTPGYLTFDLDSLRSIENRPVTISRDLLFCWEVYSANIILERLLRNKKIVLPKQGLSILYVDYPPLVQLTYLPCLHVRHCLRRSSMKI